MADTKRKKAEKLIYDVMNALDNTGMNAKKYADKFKKMNDSQFNTYMKKFLEDEDSNFYLEIKTFENEPKIQDIKKAADILKVELDEYVYMPYINGNTENPIRSVTKCPTGLAF